MTARAERIPSLDVLRGLTVAGMLLVNNPGDPLHVFTPLKHSVWHGWTPTDLVFPFFLFVVGVTTDIALRRNATPRSIVRRAAYIFGLGLLLHAFPFYEQRAVAGPAWLPPVLGHIVARFASLRVLGVLQRIALTYLAAAFIARRASSRTVATVIAVLLLAYWAAMTLLPVPGEGAIGAALLDDPARTLSAWVDRVTLDWTHVGLGWHMWDRAVPYDPEGLLGTVPATATALLGVLAARWMRAPRALPDRIAGLCAAGAIAMCVGAIWNWTFPINKPLWTSSYVLFSGGAAALAFGVVAWLLEQERWKRWLAPFLVFGTNPLLAYAGSELLASILRSSIKFKLDGHRVGTGVAVARGFEALGATPMFASLLWAVLFVALWYAILRPLHRRGVLLRV